MMKPEALDAFATQSMRPTALEAAKDDQKDAEPEAEPKSTKEPLVARPALHRLNTPFGQRTDGAESAAKAVEGVVEGLKTVVHKAVAWTEKKAEGLAHSEDRAGPYDSPATATAGISDLDAIATGVLPATVPVQEAEQDNGPDDGHKLGENQNPRS
ncbi:hypothetical protein E8E13_008499 [Curvularia kusanoi]|uniref:Uncharacterized protein n=1 Tax=Curvularia kusanoi TaxID=90978 RepID=A0A9P4TPT8_CURKU|nr:hypothetical protein E8E13_008499 [Curvularia kusanoi]